MGTKETAKIVLSLVEYEDRFVFERIEDWLIREKSEFVVSKRILLRALQLYKQDHPEEYLMLSKMMEEDPDGKDKL